MSHKISVEKKSGSIAVLTGELPYEALLKHRARAVSTLGKDVHIDGFRKGHIPESVLLQHIGEMPLISHMAELALSEHYPTWVEEHDLDVVGYPKISITKIAKDNPLGFLIEVALVPEVTLPEYRKIAAKINSEKESKEVTDTEVDDQIKEILRQKSAYERLQKKAAHGKEESHVHDEHCDHKVNAEGRESAPGYEHDAPIENAEEQPTPELTDEFIKTLGKPGQFESVLDFKNKIREHLTIEKAQQVDSRHRAKITDSIIEESSMELPQVMIDAELNQMFAQMENDLTRAQLKLDDYLSHIKKTKNDLIKEWTPSAEKRAKLQLVLNEIAKKEKIVPDSGSVDHEVSALLQHYKDADEKRVRIYVTSVLTNDAVMKMLEEVS